MYLLLYVAVKRPERMSREDPTKKEKKRILSSNKNKFYTLTRETVRWSDLVIIRSSHWWYHDKENCRAGNPFRGYSVAFHQMKKGDAINKASDQYKYISVLSKKVWVTFSYLNGLVVEIAVNCLQTECSGLTERVKVTAESTEIWSYPGQGLYFCVQHYHYH